MTLRKIAVVLALSRFGLGSSSGSVLKTRMKVRIREAMDTREVPGERTTANPRNKSGAIGTAAIVAQKTNWFKCGRNSGASQSRGLRRYPFDASQNGP